MTSDRDKPMPPLNVTSNLDQALDMLSEQDTARALHLTRSLDEALGQLSPSRAFRPEPKKEEPADTVDATIRTAETEADMEGIYRLVYDAYLEKGFIEPKTVPRLKYNSELDGIAETTVLAVEGAGLLLGTISVTLDGPAGLPADRDFKTMADTVRREGRTLAGVWRLVTRCGYTDERNLVMALIGEAVQVALRHQVQSCLCAIHPKHEHFYKRLLGMTRIAYARSMKGLLNSPGVCLRCDAEDVPEWWTR